MYKRQVLDGDNTNNELFDLLEMGNSLPFHETTVPAGSVTYRVRARVNRITNSATITGFVPNASKKSIRIIELKK